MTVGGADRRVAVVTGGGGGIGAAIALELARRGDHVVTVDPLVTVDGVERLPESEATTASRIIGDGGSAQASNASVTDPAALDALAAELMERHGRIDAVVNVAGISRPTGFARGDDADWSEVLAVHLDGYRNVLGAFVPHMATAGRGHVVGVTSGSGWRAADAGAYGCAKRAVAALTWQLARSAPAGVVINAISPIAMTRMVTAALGGRATRADRTPATRSGGGRGATTGGLSLGSMPTPDELAPLAAALAGHGSAAPHGRVIFAGGSEAALVDPPRLLEVVRTGDVADADAIVSAVAGAFEAAEGAQSTSGGSNPRFGDLFGASGNDGPTDEASSPTLRAVVVTDRDALGSAIVRALDGIGASTTTVAVDGGTGGFDGARAALAAASERADGIDALIVALSTSSTDSGDSGWERVLSEHDGLSGWLHDDAAWVRAGADLSAAADRPLRVVTVTDAAGTAGRSRAQAAAQLARASRTATGTRVAAFSIALEAPDEHAVAASLVRTLATRAGTELAGAELVIGAGWVGLRSHPRPAGSIVFGGPDLPDWFDDVLGELCR